ncbi:CD209 antigen-like isoform X2 [Solea solea]|uniref:CD209 antigen-like isoform X2 n=1 Tax=Solea solea TaxID=90069 RepID=UPI00272A4B60|nr:CD209 antigen-like isoform X2 [Solea solea]
MDGRAGFDASNNKRNLYTVVGVTLGLLCILQAVLNISLRLAFYGDESKMQLKTFDHYTHQGWLYFNQSVYYISSVKNSWQDSRDDCLQRGADLIIVNSKEEHEFTRLFRQSFWIGLTDIETEGTWKWVDGTLLRQSFWFAGEPNSNEGRNEDCGDTMFFVHENSWNDQECAFKHFWICEKTMAS